MMLLVIAGMFIAMKRDLREARKMADILCEAALVRPDHYVYATFGEAGILTRELKGLRDRLTS